LISPRAQWCADPLASARQGTGGSEANLLQRIALATATRPKAEVTYAWPRADGTVGSDREPVALFTGEAVHAYLGHLSDAAIEEMLNELATELGAALGRSPSMSRSPTGHGFWMPASMGVMSARALVATALRH
jgi:hypothetical protein